jgi:hypothetical protein
MSASRDRRVPVVRVALAGVVVPVAAALAMGAAPALATTGNAYRSQFNGSETATGSFVPFGLSVNSSGDVYVVSNAEPGVVDEFNSVGTGAPLAEFKGSVTAAGSFASVGAVLNIGGDLYVADLEHEVVDEFEPDGKLLREINGAKTKAGSFEPIGVAVNAGGDLYVADLEHEVVDEFNSTGTEVLGEINGSKTAVGSFSPLSVAVSPAGDVYVASEEEEHMVVDEFNSTGTEVLGEINGGETPQGSFFPYKVAVATSGEVYVVDIENHMVDRFSSSGTYLSQFEGGATPQGSFEPFGIAVGPGGQVYVGDGASNFVDVFSEAGPVPAVTTGSASELHPTSAVITGSIEPATGLEATCDFRNGTGASYGSTAQCVPAGPFSALTAVTSDLVGLQPGTTYHYRLEGSTSNGTTPGEDQTFTTPAAQPPTVSIRPVTAITEHSAIFNGEVTPNASETTYHFEDSTDGVHWRSLGEASAGSGSVEVPVTQSVGDLAGSTTYEVRLVAESVGGSVTSGEETFLTPAASPQIFGAGASDVTGSKATLEATIYPEKHPATYRFEFGPTAAYGTTVPVGEGAIGSAPSQVSQVITSLSPATTYHFRVVASNGVGVPTATADRTFTTLAAGEGETLLTGSCPNEALRAESNLDPQTGAPYSTQLPDCRAYEQVTPPFKSFNNVVPGAGAPVLATASTRAISTSGSPVLEDSTPLLGAAGADEELIGTYYELGRSATGWTTSSLTAAASVFPISHEELASPADVAVGLWAAATPSQSIDAEDFYRREAGGSFLNIGPVAPSSATEGPPHGAEPGTKGLSSLTDRIVGASTDLSHVVFQLDSPQSEGDQSFLWPGDGTVGVSAASQRPSLYEYAGSGHSGEGADVPSLVGVDNNGTQISQCGTGLGADVSREAHAVRNGISAGGSTIFFNAQAGGCASAATGPGVNQVYARIGTPGAQTSVNVAGTSECATSVSCNVTSPVTYHGASKDGSKVFFTTTQALLPSDKDTTSDIYECELPGDGGTTATSSGLVNACPDLQEVSVTGTSAGANVQSVVAVSEEGSHVFFTATGVLTSTANSQGRSAEGGKDNLYVWEAPGAHDPTGHTAFIATLSEASPSEAQATPDGRYLVFTTTADATLDDTSTVAQAFRYDAQSGELIRVSVGQGGFNSNGNTSSDAVSLASTDLKRLTVSEDGSYIVFQSSDALTSQVLGGVNNVYEWHDGDVYLISNGIDSTPNDGPIPKVGLIGIDASGSDVFFVTADKLVGQDTDEAFDVYDARIDGGFPAPTPAPSCSGEACQGPLSDSLAPPLVRSTGIPAVGNSVPPVTHASGTTGRIEITRHSFKRSTLTLVIKAPTGGHISASGFGLTTVRKFLTDAGTDTVKASLTARETKLRKRKRKLKLKVRVGFTPTTGKASSATITVTVTS